MRVGVIGSRSVGERFYTRLCELVPPEATEIVSGGAHGADALGKRYAQEHGLKYTEFAPDYARYRRGAPIKRNARIAEYADFVVALWDGKSHGTANAVHTCLKVHTPVDVVICDPDSPQPENGTVGDGCSQTAPGQPAQAGTAGETQRIDHAGSRRRIGEWIRGRVRGLYWDEGVNCAGTALACLSELFGVALEPQMRWSAVGMHGAGGYRAQCGLVEGALMFTGIYLHTLGKTDAEIAAACYRFASAFEETFGSLRCLELRPSGFSENDPPHLCEGLTCRAIGFACHYIQEITGRQPVV